MRKKAMSAGSKMRASKTRNEVGELPFCLAEHEWILGDWLKHVPKDRVVRDFGPDNLVLVRRALGLESAAREEQSGSIDQPEVTKWPAELHDKKTKLFFEADRELANELKAQSKFRADATSCLWIKANDLMGKIVALARGGDRVAFGYLRRTAFESVAELNRFAVKNPEFVKKSARGALEWPVMKSLVPWIGDDHEELFRSIDLGGGTGIRLDKSSKWKLDPAGKIAWRLHARVFRERGGNEPIDDAQNHPPGSFKSLPPFTDKTSAAQWWCFAEAVLLLTYPEPELIPELNRLVTGRTHRRTPGRIRRSILAKIKARFMSFAAK